MDQVHEIVPMVVRSDAGREEKAMVIPGCHACVAREAMPAVFGPILLALAAVYSSFGISFNVERFHYVDI